MYLDSNYLTFNKMTETAPGRHVTMISGPQADGLPSSHVIPTYADPGISEGPTLDLSAFPIMEEGDEFLPIIEGREEAEKIEVVLFGNDLKPLMQPLGLKDEDIATGQQVAIRRYAANGETMIVIQIFRYQGGTKDTQGLRFGRMRVVKAHKKPGLYTLLQSLHSQKKQSIDKARLTFANRCHTVVSRV